MLRMKVDELSGNSLTTIEGDLSQGGLQTIPINSMGELGFSLKRALRPPSIVRKAQRRVRRTITRAAKKAIKPPRALRKVIERTIIPPTKIRKLTKKIIRKAIVPSKIHKKIIKKTFIKPLKKTVAITKRIDPTLKIYKKVEAKTGLSLKQQLMMQVTSSLDLFARKKKYIGGSGGISEAYNQDPYESEYGMSEAKWKSYIKKMEAEEYARYRAEVEAGQVYKNITPVAKKSLAIKSGTPASQVSKSYEYDQDKGIEHQMYVQQLVENRKEAAKLKRQKVVIESVKKQKKAFIPVVAGGGLIAVFTMLE